MLLGFAPMSPGQSKDIGRTLPPGTAANYAGCYELSMGRWWPWAFGEDTKYVTPPKRIELSPDVETEGFGKDRLAVRSLPFSAESASSPTRRASFWTVGKDEKIEITWTDGFTGLTVELNHDGSGLSGWAHPHFDSAKFIPRIAHVTAKRIACN